MEAHPRALACDLEAGQYKLRSKWDALVCNLAEDMFVFGARLMGVAQHIFHNAGQVLSCSVSGNVTDLIRVEDEDKVDYYVAG